VPGADGRLHGDREHDAGDWRVDLFHDIVERVDHPREPVPNGDLSAELYAVGEQTAPVGRHDPEAVEHARLRQRIDVLGHRAEPAQRVPYTARRSFDGGGRRGQADGSFWMEETPEGTTKGASRASDRCPVRHPMFECTTVGPGPSPFCLVSTPARPVDCVRRTPALWSRQTSHRARRSAQYRSSIRDSR
jgi:hypothetical protein